MTFSRDAKENLIADYEGAFFTDNVAADDTTVAEFLRSAQDLRLLDLSGTRIGDITFFGARFTMCQSIEYLDLSGTAVTEEAVQDVLKNFKSLRHLRLSRCAGVTDSVALASALTVLKSVKISSLYVAHLPESCVLDTAFFNVIKSMTSLEHLDVSGSAGVTDDNLKSLLSKRTSKLRTLAARDMGVTGSFLTALSNSAASPMLESVDIRGCNLDVKRIERVNKSRPHLIILYDSEDADAVPISGTRKRKAATRNSSNTASTSRKKRNTGRIAGGGKAKKSVHPDDFDIVDAAEMIEQLYAAIDERNLTPAARALCIPEIFGNVISFLELRDFAPIAQVCSSWYRATIRCKRWLRVVDLGAHQEERSSRIVLDDEPEGDEQNNFVTQESVGDRYAYYARRRRRAQIVPPSFLNRPIIDDSVLDLLVSDCPRLKTLRLNDCEAITDIGISLLLSQLHELEELDVSGCVLLSQACLKKIERTVPSLRTLHLHGLDLTSAFARNIGDTFPNLERISITEVRSSYRNDVYFWLFRHCPSLKGVEIENCSSVDLVFNQLFQNPSLEAIKISGSRGYYSSFLSGSSIQRMAKIYGESLRELRLSCLRIFDGLSGLFQRCTELRIVILEKAIMPVTTIRDVLSSPLPHLEQLCVQSPTAFEFPKDSSSYASFVEHTELRQFSFRWTGGHIPSAFLAALHASAPNLRHLTLIPYDTANAHRAHTELDCGALLRSVASHWSQLESLTIPAGLITREDLHHFFTKCPRIRRFTVEEGGRLSQEILDALLECTRTYTRVTISGLNPK